jgi:O-antigen/teichoic acid export membrane protein
MNNNTSSYRQIFKATSIFGGAQVFNILIGIVRAKFVALFLGTAGYGIFGLLNAPLLLITNITGLGISFSAVRDISAANTDGDHIKLSRTVLTFRRWVWFTGLLGLLATIVLSPLLSQWSFGHKDYTIAFILLSSTLLIKALSDGQSALLRGMRRIKDTAKAGMIGSFLGLFTTLPLYYLYGFKGIVPSIIIAALTTLLLSWIFARKVKIFSVEITYKESYLLGKAMVKLGVIMTLSGVITTAITYIISIFINKTGGVSQVGLYNAGWAITNQYVGLIFTAMAVDYFPKLAGIHKNNTEVKKAVNEQAEIAILIVGPIMILYLTSLPILIPLFYTTEFLSIVPFTQWIIFGMLFKTASWAIGYIILAKGESKLFLVTEVLSNVFLLVFNVFSYKYLGLEGIGISFAVLYLLHFIVIYFICYKKFEFVYSTTFIKIFITQILLCGLAFGMVRIFGYPIGYYSGTGILIIAAIISISALNKRMDIKQIIRKYLNKNEK